MLEQLNPLQHKFTRRQFLTGSVVVGAAAGLTSMIGCSSEQEKGVLPTPEMKYQELWSKYLLSSVVVTDDGVLVTETLDGLLKLDLKTGDVIWNRRDVHGEITWYDNERLYLITGVGGPLRRVDPVTGDVLWEWYEGIRDPYDYDGGNTHSVELLNNGTFFVEGSSFADRQPFFLDADTGQFISNYDGVHIDERINTDSGLQYVSPVGYLPTKRIGDIEFHTERYFIGAPDPRDSRSIYQPGGSLELDFWSVSANKIIKTTPTNPSK